MESYVREHRMVIKKGASLQETWAKTGPSVLHLIGWKFGYCGLRFGEYDLGVYGNCLDRTYADSCLCACSSSCCLLLTMFLKGHWHWRSTCGSTKTITSGNILDSFLSITASPEHRRLVTEIIRLISFHALEIRHTCCNPGRILWSEEPDFNISLFDGDSDSESDQGIADDEYYRNQRKPSK